MFKMSAANGGIQASDESKEQQLDSSSSCDAAYAQPG